MGPASRGHGQGQGKDRTVLADAEEPPPSPSSNCNTPSTRSATTTTPSDPTAPSDAKPPGSPTNSSRKPPPTRPDDPDIWRVRYDTIDNDGKITLSHHGRLLHLGIGRAHTRTEIVCLVHNDDATINDLITGELLAEFTLDPEKNHQRKTVEPPETGGPTVHDVLRYQTAETRGFEPLVPVRGLHLSRVVHSAGLCDVSRHPLREDRMHLASITGSRGSDESVLSR